MKKLFWFSSSFVSLNEYMQSTQYIIRVQYMFLSLPSVPRPLIFVDHISNKHKQGFLFVCCDGNNAACTSGTKGPVLCHLTLWRKKRKDPHHKVGWLSSGLNIPTQTRTSVQTFQLFPSVYVSPLLGKLVMNS